MIRIDVEVSFKNGAYQKDQIFQIDETSSPNDRFIRLFRNEREFLFNSDIIKCIEILNCEVE